MIVAVTGASGFVGRFLCRDLSRDYQVRAVVRTGAEERASVPDVAPITDLADRAALAAAFAGAELVVHLAGRSHRLREQPGDALTQFRRANVEGTAAVMDAAKVAGVRRVIVASSVKAVGESSASPWTEDTVPAPVDSYGRSKLQAERLAFERGLETGIEVVVARFPLVYGPGAPANVRRLLDLVASGMPLPFGALHNRRSMLFLGNLAEAIRRLAVASGIAGRVFFVSDGVDLSTPQLVRCVANGLGRRPRLVAVPAGLLRLLGRAGDLVGRILPVPVTSAEVDRLIGSLAVRIDLLQRLTGYQPPYTPEAGWRETAMWYAERRL